MAPRQREPLPEPSSGPGILSNVLSFVTREIESFVTTAVGGNEVQVEERTRPRASTSRVKLDGDVTKKRRRRKDSAHRLVQSEVEYEEGVPADAGPSRRRSHRPVDSDPETPRTRRPRKKTPSGPTSPSPTPARTRAADPYEEETSYSREYTIPINDTPSSRPPSPTTPPPLPSLLKPKKVVTMPGSFFPRSESLIPESPPSPEPERRVSWLPRTPSPTPTSPRKTEKTLRQIEKSEKAKGKERAGDTSGEVQVRGKERELRAAREAHARHEPGRDDDERERDKLRIRMLEDEIAWLRAQLSAQHTHSTRAMPPPPAPPPPPPMAKLFKAPGTPTVARANKFLASARANLKPTTPPVEAPINSAVGRTRRAGQPTVNVPSDKMAAFLNEVKTVRLRKVSTGEGDSRSMPPPRYVPGERSFSTVENKIGEKRKRDAFFAGDTDPGPSKKRNTTYIAPGNDTGSSMSSQSSQSSQTSANSSLFFPPPDHVPPRGWPSVATTETDITTPSLCSDNENENEQDADERLPPTPPHNRIQHSVPSHADKRRASTSREPIDVDAEFPEPDRIVEPRHQAARLKKEKTPPFVDFFARRPPKSPLPPTPVRKVPAPARKRAKPVPAPPVDGDMSDGDDPLSMSLPDLGRPGATPHPARPAQKSRSRTSSNASRDSGTNAPGHSVESSTEAPYAG
ncbi:hypothetical protein EVJ58_g6410 [Rhodofomes roseus]|uniref:Uncharacterized protein n=1 Tax=Rhodofomes roseus TaxID=34475 RepID=A0A4Y9Y8G2_9APHY|nr:hypothetical protein EVJ58_g6410 [Rhodofomes roseus]